MSVIAHPTTTSDSIQHDAEPKSNALRARLDAITGRGQRTKTPTQAVIDGACGVHLHTADGRDLFDMASGVLVANLGHNHAGFEARYEAYCKGLPRNSYNMLTPIEIEAAERLVKSFGYARAEKVLWAASGSEGIQKSMWAALHYRTDRPMMIATRGGFHGKKGLAADVTGETSTNPNVRFISFPLHEPKPEAFYQAELDALAAEFPDQIALLITEPYLGARGSFHPPAWYHQMLQAWCRKHDIAFIFDEVQSCHGRTGNMYAFQSYGVEPDLVVLGKGLANGEPASAVVGRASLIDALNYGEASDTFSGTPHACAAVCAVFDVFADDKIVEHCKQVAPVMRAALESLKSKFSFIRAIRGEGLVFGVEMDSNERAVNCVLEAYHGSGNKGVHFLGPLSGNVLRVSPPLIITEAEIAEIQSILETAWARCA